MSTSKADFGRSLCRESYCAYLYHVHRGAWKPSPFHTWLADTVQDFIEKKTENAYDILEISVPPQHGKSMSITETLPSWYIGNYPDNKCILISYNEMFAGKFGRRNKQKIEEFGEDIFNIQLAKSTDTEMEFEGKRGSIISRGILSGITGNPANLMIIDDPVKNREEADSPTTREKIYAEWESSMRTRLAPGAKVIVMMTRWHDGDLFGELSRKEPNCTIINIPCEAEENDILGRSPGEPLCPEIGKGMQWLKQIKEAHNGGNRTWYALYQGKPAVDGGNIIKEKWWKYYSELPEKFDYTVISVDCAFKDNKNNDYVAIGIWGKSGADAYLIDLVREHLDFMETVEAIITVTNKYPERKAIYIEDKANGSAVISALRRHISGIIPVTPKDSKLSRVNSILDYIEAGNVYIPKFAAFKDMFVSECSLFPNGEHDDMVDQMTQALEKLMRLPAVIPKGEKSAIELHREKILSGKRK